RRSPHPRTPRRPPVTHPSPSRGGAGVGGGSAARQSGLDLVGDDIDGFEDRGVDRVGDLQGDVVDAEALVFGELARDLARGSAEVVTAAEELVVDGPLVDAVDEDRDAHRPLGLAVAPRFLPEPRDRLLALPESLGRGAGRVPAVTESRDPA